jgi:hypothetical protein
MCVLHKIPESQMSTFEVGGTGAMILSGRSSLPSWTSHTARLFDISYCGSQGAVKLTHLHLPPPPAHLSSKIFVSGISQHPSLCKISFWMTHRLLQFRDLHSIYRLY